MFHSTNTSATTCKEGRKTCGLHCVALEREHRYTMWSGKCHRKQHSTLPDIPQGQCSRTLDPRCPSRNIVQLSPKGIPVDDVRNFMNFLKKHLYEHTKPSKDRPVLMILDNHASHCSEGAFRFCRENYITPLSFPRNATPGQISLWTILAIL
ncbi:hypothetical protein RRG08_003082 [Elysia crispata]|uniref:DDE-1 domain-containing protein n=1 Tax=Elysia crispata TaxID=231223 RepID=A0AAE1B861_9GAST|nr:hypothetical protein RRG08_003082 [Elysia crispata]